uniref:Uncharacterized protein n=1 Tax=Anolis carolinensis TaxID=28377 RepID=A0A803TBF0_ANOCA
SIQLHLQGKGKIRVGWHHWWNLVLGRNSGRITEKYSVGTHIVMGSISGWYAGFLFQKVRKLGATGVGGGFLLLQVNIHTCLQQTRGFFFSHPGHYSTDIYTSLA